MVTMADDSKYPTRIAPYGLRMQPDLKARIEAAAQAHDRSMHTEIIAALEEKFPPVIPGRVEDRGARLLLALAKRIRDRDPKQGSFRAIQAELYERTALELIAKFDEKSTRTND
jgi:hypothetical protein